MDELGPNVVVTGVPYLPGQAMMTLASCLSMVFYIGLLLTFFGKPLFTALKFGPGARLCTWMDENKMGSFCALLACNMAASQLMATGAFEVHYDGDLPRSRGFQSWFFSPDHNSADQAELSIIGGQVEAFRPGLDARYRR